jgi:hypothetical protein
MYVRDAILLTFSSQTYSPSPVDSNHDPTSGRK